MKLRLGRLLAIAAFVCSCLAGGPALTQNAYIPNGGSGTVSVIDTTTNAVSPTTITVGNGPYSVAVTPDGGKVYVADVDSNTVSMIDTTHSNAVTTITDSSFNGPAGVAVTPDGSKVYVTNCGISCSGNANGRSTTVSVIDTTHNNAVTAITVGRGPSGVAVTPDGKTVYVANAGDNTVSVIATATNAVTTIADFNEPEAVAVSPDGSKVYVVNFGDDTVFVIDTASNTVTGSPIGVGTAPLGVAVTPDGGKVYVANFGDNTVSLIDTTTNAVTTIPVGIGSGPSGVAVTPDGSKVYVTNFSDNTVSVIATSNNAVTTINSAEFNGPLSDFGVFIQSAPRFAGTPKISNCRGVSVSALSIQYGGNLSAAAKALGFSSVQALQNAIRAFCGE